MGEGEEENKINIKLIGFILLIAFLAIILLWWYFNFKPSEIVSESDCRNSIKDRAMLNIKDLGIGIESVPLRCKVEYVCYVKAGAFTKNSCPDNYNVVKINSKQGLIKDLVEREAKWWSISGAGELNYAPKNYASPKPFCIQAGRFIFDKSITYDSSMAILTYDDFWSYMEANQVGATGKNYIQYVYGGKNNINTANDFKEYLKKFWKDNENVDVKDPGKIFIMTNEPWILFFGIAQESWLRETGEAFLAIGTLGVFGMERNVYYLYPWFFTEKNFQQASCSDVGAYS